MFKRPFKNFAGLVPKYSIYLKIINKDKDKVINKKNVLTISLAVRVGAKKRRQEKLWLKN
jgi:hypothetical protein